MNRTFQVEFYENGDGVNSRRKIVGSNTFNLEGARSDFAVQSYLQRLYPNSQITIINIEWR